MKTYTISEIAKLLKIPESTARYYRDRFADFIPFTGTGRSRRYLPQALEAMQLISDMMKENSPGEAIEEALESRFGVTIDPLPGAQQHIATTQQQLIDPAPFLGLLAQQSADIALLRKEIEDLHKTLEDKEEGRDRKLMEVMQLLQEKKKPWWKKFLN